MGGPHGTEGEGLGAAAFGRVVRDVAGVADQVRFQRVHGARDPSDGGRELPDPRQRQRIPYGPTPVAKPLFAKCGGVFIPQGTFPDAPVPEVSLTSVIAIVRGNIARVQNCTSRSLSVSPSARATRSASRTSRPAWHGRKPTTPLIKTRTLGPDTEERAAAGGECRRHPWRGVVTALREGCLSPRPASAGAGPGTPHRVRRGEAAAARGDTSSPRS